MINDNLIFHKDLVTEDIHVPGYIQSTDPGPIGGGKMWVDTDLGLQSYVIKIRDITNAYWTSPTQLWGNIQGNILNQTDLIDYIATHGGSGSETDPLSLHLDQTTPQTVTGGQPNFSLGIDSPTVDMLYGGIVGNALNGDGEQAVTLTSTQSVDMKGATGGYINFRNDSTYVAYFVLGSGNFLTKGNIRVGSTTGVSFTGLNGVLTLAGLKTAGNNENLIFDFETTSNTVGVSSTTGVTRINFGSISLTATSIIETTPTLLKLDQTTPQTTTVGTFSFQDVRTLNSGTVTRDSTTGLVSSIGLTGLRTMTFTRNTTGYVTSMTDGTKTWTYTRDTNNNITAWAVV